MPKVSEQYKDDQRAQILDAARRCFLRDGFHRTSMQDVFAESGRSAGAVYRYFPKKDDLIVGVAAGNLDDVANVLHEALASNDSPRGLGEVLADVLTAVADRHADRELAAVALMVWSESLRNPALADRLRDAIATMTRALADLVAQRQESGELAGPAPEALAQAILSILPGFLLNLAILGPAAVADFPAAVRTLWPGQA